MQSVFEKTVFACFDALRCRQQGEAKHLSGQGVGVEFQNLDQEAKVALVRCHCATCAFAMPAILVS